MWSEWTGQHPRLSQSNDHDQPPKENEQATADDATCVIVGLIPTNSPDYKTASRPGDTRAYAGDHDRRFVKGGVMDALDRAIA